MSTTIQADFRKGQFVSSGDFSIGIINNLEIPLLPPMPDQG
jgi:hypothetical protein